MQTNPLENFMQGCHLCENLSVYKMMWPKHKCLFFCKGRYIGIKCES